MLEKMEGRKLKETEVVQLLKAKHLQEAVERQAPMFPSTLNGICRLQRKSTQNFTATQSFVKWWLSGKLALAATAASTRL